MYNLIRVTCTPVYAHYNLIITGLSSSEIIKVLYLFEQLLKIILFSDDEPILSTLSDEVY
jgi:hypothetical protein